MTLIFQDTHEFECVLLGSSVIFRYILQPLPLPPSEKMTIYADWFDLFYHTDILDIMLYGQGTFLNYNLPLY